MAQALHRCSCARNSWRLTRAALSQQPAPRRSGLGHGAQRRRGAAHTCGCAATRIASRCAAGKPAARLRPAGRGSSHLVAQTSCPDTPCARSPARARPARIWYSRRQERAERGISGCTGAHRADPRPGCQLMGGRANDSQRRAPRHPRAHVTPEAPLQLRGRHEAVHGRAGGRNIDPPRAPCFTRSAERYHRAQATGADHACNVLRHRLCERSVSHRRACAMCRAVAADAGRASHAAMRWSTM